MESDEPGVLSCKSTPRRHPSLYFPDGDLVLASETKNSKSSPESNGTAHFRVHRFIPSHHSSVFADMLRLPNMPSVNESIDGVDIVHLQDDSSDVEALLEVLYNPATALRYKRFDPDMCFSVMGVLRLAKKYQVDSVLDFIVEHVKYDWPTTLDTWLLRRREMLACKELYNSPKNQHGKVEERYFDECFPEPASTIRLAQDFGAESILPASFYALACTPMDNDWDMSRSGLIRTTLEQLHRTARWSLLDRHDLSHLGVGAARLQRAVISIFSAFSVPGICPGGRGYPIACSPLLKDAIQQRFNLMMANSAEWSYIQADPIGILEDIKNTFTESLSQMQRTCRVLRFD